MGSSSFAADDFETNSAFSRSSNSSVDQHYVFGSPGNAADPVDLPGNPGDMEDEDGGGGNPGDPLPIDDYLPVFLFVGILMVIYFSYKIKHISS